MIFEETAPADSRRMSKSRTYGAVSASKPETPTDIVLRGRLAALSEGQLQVLALVAQYKSSKEIARMLGISPNTVDQRLKRVQAILGVAGRFEAARLYSVSVTQAGSSAQALWGNLVYQPSDLSSGTPARDGGPSPGEWNRPGDGPAMFNQPQAIYAEGFVGWGERKPWYVVLFEADRTNDLTLLMRAICIGAIALTSILTLAAAVSLVEGLSRIF